MESTTAAITAQGGADVVFGGEGFSNAREVCGQGATATHSNAEGVSGQGATAAHNASGVSPSEMPNLPHIP